MMAGLARRSRAKQKPADNLHSELRRRPRAAELSDNGVCHHDDDRDERADDNREYPTWPARSAGTPAQCRAQESEKKPGRFGFRGDIALKFQTQLADEKRPPEFSIEQVLTIAQEGESTIPVLVGYLHSFAYLEVASEVLDGLLSPGGTYFMFCNNIDLLAKYRVTLRGIAFHVLPCDESTVWKEMLDLLGIDKNDIKKLDTAGKLDYLLDAAAGFDGKYDVISFEEGLARMEPVKNRNENRPV